MEEICQRETLIVYVRTSSIHELGYKLTLPAIYVFLLRIASYPLSLSLNISFNSARRVSSICCPVVMLSLGERGKEGEGNIIYWDKT